MSRYFKNIWKTVSIAVIFTAIVAVGSIQAATISGVTHIPASLKTSASTNHTLSFTTPTGVSEGSTITITFDSDFDTSSIVEDDIDITDDATDLTTASDCTGSEEASVAIASDVITITICSGDGGAIAASSAVVLEIGSNATSSGTGANKITNPSNAGTYFMGIAGTFGDLGSIALPISASNNAVAVTFTIPEAAASTPPPVVPEDTDETAPTISSVVVSETSTTSTTVSWTTDEAADSAVDYGKTEAVDEGTAEDASLGTSHEITIPGLTEGITYYFKVRSSDSASNEGESSTQTFSTLDETAPVFTSKGVEDITGSTAKIVWSTDESTTGLIEYGTTDAYGLTAASSSPATSHSVTLRGFSTSTSYHYRVLASDLSSNQTVSADGSFTTTTNLPPSNVTSFSVAAGVGKNNLSWTNPEDLDLSGVKIIVCTNEAPSAEDDADCTQVYSDSGEAFEHTGLTNGTTYYYGAFSFDTAGQFASGALGSGKPSALEEEVPLEDEKDTKQDVLEDQPADSAEQSQEQGQGQTSQGSQGLSDGGQAGSSGSGSSSSGSAEVCGNNQCSGSETAFSCPQDCLDSDSASLGAEAGAGLSGIGFIVGRGAVALKTKTGFIDVIGGSELSIQVPAKKLGKGVKSASIVLDSNKYLLRPIREAEQLSRAYGFSARGVAASKEDKVLYYVADIITPKVARLHPFTIFVDYADSTETISSFLNVVAPGYAFEVIDGEEKYVSGVKVTLFDGTGRKAAAWDGSPFGQFNPVTTGSDGTVAWYVPNGQYSVRAEHKDYRRVKTGGFTVSNNIAGPRLVMASIKGIEEPLSLDNALLKAAVTLDAIIDTPVVEALHDGLEVVREIPGVEEAAVVSVPTLAVTAGASVVVMSVAFDFLPFLQYLFTAPILFFFRRRREGYGTVYSAVSKEPVDLAVVRLFQVDQTGALGKLVKSRVTDKAGRFFFLVQPGKYKLTVTKVGFQFPTEYLKEVTEDGKYLDVYHSEMIDVTEKDAVITPNIPLDPSKADKFTKPSSIRWRAKLRALQHVVALSGVVASIVFAIIRPNVLAVSMVFVQIGVYIVAQRIAKPNKPKSWGIINDKTTGRPLENVVARIFEPKYNKLLETRVTDSKGRYTFLLGPSRYYAVFEKPGYTSAQVNPIDYTRSKDSQDFSENISLNPGSSDASHQIVPGQKPVQVESNAQTQKRSDLKDGQSTKRISQKFHFVETTKVVLKKGFKVKAGSHELNETQAEPEAKEPVETPEPAQLKETKEDSEQQDAESQK